MGFADSFNQRPDFSVSFYPGSCACFENVACHSPYQFVSGVLSFQFDPGGLRSEVGLCHFSPKNVRIFAPFFFVAMFFTDAGSTTCSSAMESLLFIIRQVYHDGWVFKHVTTLLALVTSSFNFVHGP